MKQFLALTAVAAMLTLSACGNKEKEQEAAAKQAEASPLLEYVPADTPYVYGALAPSPDAVADKMEPLLEAIIPAVRSQLDAAIDRKLTKKTRAPTKS